jgi:Fic family protein
MEIATFQAGSYKQQYQYKSFSPAKVNHCWAFADPEIQTLLSEADRALGELNAYSQLVPDIDFFIRLHITKEATQSSRLEGTHTNMEDALLDEKDIAPEKRDDWIEVQNYIRAINTAIEQLETVPLSIRLLRDTHHTLMQGARGEYKQPGEFRTSQNWIGVSLKHAVFVPPHQDEVGELMSDLELFMQNEEIQVPHLIRIGIAHYQFETIHPFLDGNGRLGRLMIALYLANFKLLQKPALYLSDYFERNKTAYVDNLMAVREANDMRRWLIFFLFGIRQTARNSIKVFKNILMLKSRLESEVLPRFSSRRQQNAQVFARQLYQTPLVSVKDVTELLDVNPNTAAALVNDFVRYGILKNLGDNKRNRLFYFADYLAIFHDDLNEDVA